MTENLLSVRHLSKKFNTHRIIDDLSFDIGASERVTLFAPSGSGKTTLINILTGLEPYDGGWYSFIKEAPVTIFQESRLFPFLTVEENIFLPYKVQGKPISAALRQSYQDWLAVCQLTSSTHLYPHQLSGGMKQKVALIRGLLGDPHLVLMDEPFQSIDWASKRAIMAHILATNPRIAMLFVTHQEEEIPALAQSVLFFHSPCLKKAVEMDVAAFQSFQSNRLRAMQPYEINHTEMCVA